MPAEGDSFREWGALYRLLFERAGEFILLFEPRPDGSVTIVDVNEAAARAHGYRRDELIGQPITLIDPFVSPETVAARTAELERSGSLVFEVRRRRRDGSVFDVELSAALVRGGARTLILSMERDVTRRKHDEEQLRHMHRLMTYVIGHARSAIAVHDRDLRYVYVSERYLKDYNVTERDIIGKHHYDVFPDLPQKWRDVHQRALRGEVCSAEEDPYPRADGTVEWTRWECRPWYEGDGSIGGIIVYTEVITERKHLEDDRRALEAQLQQAMKMEAVGRLAGGIAHDFNNLLTVIGGNAELALMSLRPDDPIGERLREVTNATDRAAALTRQLLAFSRKQIIEPRLIDLNELIAELQRMLQRLIGEDVALRTVAGRELSAVRVDPGQFEQILVNLAVNARDAMPQGGQLHIETRDVELDSSYCDQHAGVRPGPYVMLAVSDTGHGMSDEVKRHLFEPFFTTKGLGRGTGLGLATTFGIVAQAGGAIEVYSEVGRGTTFKIYLPAIEGEATRLERERAAREAPGGHETVLLVEDDAAVRNLAAQVLERLGYTVIAASDGAEALELAANAASPIDLLVTDVVMPGMNGRELAVKITAAYPGVRVLYSSGYTEDIIVHHGIVDEELRFVAKPYTPLGLAQRVRDVLDEQR